MSPVAVTSTSAALVVPKLEAVAGYDELAVRTGSPFLTAAWLTCWWHAYGRGEPAWITVGGDDGCLRAAALVQQRGRSVIGAANVHSGDWDVLGQERRDRVTVWEGLTSLGAAHIECRAIPDWNDGAAMAEESMCRAGYRVFTQAGAQSPRLDLPSTWPELLTRVSRGLRSQLGRRERALQRIGTLELRRVVGGPTLDHDLNIFLALEASGWKRANGTAILCHPRTQRLYRDFAHAAARRGWFRLYLLELDGQAIAGDYGCAVGGVGSLIKTAFSERHARLSPGLVLRGAVLRACIEEGLHAYNFHGEADEYKRRWTPELCRHTSVWAYKGAYAPGYTYRRRVRPILKSVHARASRRSRRRLRT